MPVPEHVVVVGAGLAAARCVATLRSEGFGGALTLIGAEPELPYERPGLSKGYLMGKDSAESLTVHSSDWYQEHSVDVLQGTRVVELEPDARIVELDGGRRLGWDAMLLATGASARRLGLPGEGLIGVHHLRTLADSTALRDALSTAQHLVIVGGGWIGLEAAAAARQAGVAVTVLERGELPLAGVLGIELARVFAELHREHDVDLRVGVQVAGIVGDAGRVVGVALADGQVLPADTVLVAVGAQPETGLAADAGLVVDTGVLADATLRTSAPGIYVAGDVAEPFHPVLGRPIRVEHWDNAREQGTAAARSILGEPVSYDRLPYFYTDQYDLGMEYTGYAPPGQYDEVVLRGDVPGRAFVALWVADGRVLAGMGVNVWDAMDPVRDLVTSARRVDPDRLRDPDVALTQL